MLRVSRTLAERVAHLYEPSVARALKSVEFTGGEASVQRPLEKLGFTVIRFPKGARTWSSPLVLVENEVTLDGRYDFWADETGVRYQYPNQYRNKVQTGRPFVYYRGVRRAGRKRGPTSTSELGPLGKYGATLRSPRMRPSVGGDGTVRLRTISPLPLLYQPSGVKRRLNRS